MRVCPRCSTETLETICPDDGATTIPVQEADANYAAGTLIADRYRVDKVIGIGGFGAVYRCTQLNLNQTVAVKVLRNEHLTSVEHVKRFTREAQAVSKLKHPNTIRVSDFGVHSDGALYIVMEYVEGETLGHRLDTHTTVYWETLVHIMNQVCHSLTEAHSGGLVHRDLKPENIMLLSVAGDPNFVKVLDFGIAKERKAGAPDGQSLTEAGMIMGTPTYMSPEQAKGEQVDARSDIYALGVMMYESLTGKPPFQGESPMTVLVAHIKDLPRPMPRDGSIPNVPPAVEKVVLSCLEKEPALRPQSTVQLVDRLVTAMKSVREPALSSRSQAAVEATVGMQGLDTGTLTAVQPTSMSPAAAQFPIGSPVSGGASPVPRALPLSRAPLWIGLGAFAVVAIVAVTVAMVAQDPPASAAAATLPVVAAPEATAPVLPTPATAAPEPPAPAVARPREPAANPLNPPDKPTAPSPPAAQVAPPDAPRPGDKPAPRVDAKAAVVPAAAAVAPVQKPAAAPAGQRGADAGAGDPVVPKKDPPSKGPKPGDFDLD